MNKKLKTIEGICLFWEDSKKSLDVANNLLTDIYTISHPDKSCPHHDWESIPDEISNKLKHLGII